jgi:hypothetical protein
MGLLLPTALLETRGARMGRLRRNGVIYFHDDERVTIIGSKPSRIRHVPRSRSSSSFLFTRLKHHCPLRTSSRARSRDTEEVATAPRQAGSRAAPLPRVPG